MSAISSYLEVQGGVSAANRVCRLIYNEVQMLRRFPGSGRPGKEPGTRETVVQGAPAYLIVYSIGFDDTVYIVRVWHGARLR